MSVDVVFPPMARDGDGATGVLATWFVADGDLVHADQLLAEVQVDKVSAELTAPVGGIVRLLVPVEAEVAAGSVVATVEEPGRTAAVR